LRGKAWSIDEERLLRQLVQEGKGTEEISQVMGKTRLSIKGKLNNLRLSLVVATGQKRAVATTTTTTPSLVNAADSVPIPNPGGFDVVAEGLKSNEPLPSIEEKLRALDAALGFKSYKKSPFRVDKGRNTIYPEKRAVTYTYYPRAMQRKRNDKNQIPISFYSFREF